MFEGMKIYKSELWGEQKATGRVLVHIPMNKLLVLESFLWSFKNHLSLLRSGPSSILIPNPTPQGRCASMRGSCRTALLEDARSRLSPRGPRNVWTVWTPLELPGSPTGRSYESEDLCHQGISAGNMSISWSKDASTIGFPAANADSDIVDSGPDWKDASAQLKVFFIWWSACNDSYINGDNGQAEKAWTKATPWLQTICPWSTGMKMKRNPFLLESKLLLEELPGLVLN